MRKHKTTTEVRPYPPGFQGGTWKATCWCGWAQHGDYVWSDPIAEAWALRLATAYGRLHEGRK